MIKLCLKTSLMCVVNVSLLGLRALARKLLNSYCRGSQGVQEKNIPMLEKEELSPLFSYS